MLDLVAARSTCIRRTVGCIITDKNGYVLSMGYNGTPRDFDHCVSSPCAGAGDKPGDTSMCMAIHAEQNALLQCHRLDLAYTMYVTCTPCFVCSKLISNTNIEHIICKQNYADERGKRVLLERGITLEIAGKMIDA